MNCGTPLPACAAACETAMDLTRQVKGVDYAVTVVEEMRHYAHGAELPALVPHAERNAGFPAGGPGKSRRCPPGLAGRQAAGDRRRVAWICAITGLAGAGSRGLCLAAPARRRETVRCSQGIRPAPCYPWRQAAACGAPACVPWAQWVGLECAAGRPGKARTRPRAIPAPVHGNRLRQAIRTRPVPLPARS